MKAKIINNELVIGEGEGYKELVREDLEIGEVYTTFLEFEYTIEQYKKVTEEYKLQVLNTLQNDDTKFKYENHKAKGWEAYQNFRSQIVADIASETLTEPKAFLIEDLLSVAYDKISASGDWKTAYHKLLQVTIPTEYTFVQSYYDKALQEIATYIAVNYE